MARAKPMKKTNQCLVCGVTFDPRSSYRHFEGVKHKRRVEARREALKDQCIYVDAVLPVLLGADVSTQE